MGLRGSLSSTIRRFADLVGPPAFAGTPYPSGEGARDQLGKELGGTGTQLFGGFLRGEDWNPEMDSLTAVKNFDIMRRSDAQVNAALQVIMQPIRSADVAIDPAGPDPVHMKAAQFVEWNLMGGGSIGWDDFLRQALLCLVFGYYLFEKVWMVQEGGQYDGLLRYRKLAPRPPKTIWQWFTDESGVLLSVKQLAVKAGTFQFLDIPADKLVRFTFNQEGDNFAGISVLRTAYPHWKIKQELYIVDAIRAVRYGCGVPRAKVKAGYAKNVGDKDQLIQTLMGMSSHQHSYIIEPEDVAIDILMPQGSQGGSEVLPTIEHHNEQITRNVLATFLDMGGKSQGGSNALGSSAMDFFANAIIAIADQMTSVIDNQVIKPLVAANFDVDEFPTIRFSGIKQDNLADIAKIIASLSAAGMTFTDIQTQNSFRDRLDLPELTSGDLGTTGTAAAPGAPVTATPGKAPTKVPPPAGGGAPSGGGEPATSHAPAGSAASAAPGGAVAKSPAHKGGAASSAAPAGGTAVPTGPPTKAAAPPPITEQEQSDVSAESEDGASVPRGTPEEPVEEPEVNLPANQFEQAMRPADEPSAAQAARTTAAVDHTELARTDGAGVVPAKSHGWDSVASVPAQPRTTDGMTQAVSRGIPPQAHMARSTTITSSGAADEEGHMSSVAASHGKPQPLAVASRPMEPVAPATTGIPIPAMSRHARAASDGLNRSMTWKDAPVVSQPPQVRTGTTSRARGRTTPDRMTPEDPTTFWRAPTPLEARVLDLREMPRRLDAERTALAATLRNIREVQLSRIAFAVAHGRPGDAVKAPLVGKMVADVVKATTAVYEFGRASVIAELKKQKAAKGPFRTLADHAPIPTNEEIADAIERVPDLDDVPCSDDYDETQRALADAGVTDLVVFRGIGQRGAAIEQAQAVMLDHRSAFSYSIEPALAFGENVIAMRVSARRVLALPGIAKSRDVYISEGTYPACLVNVPAQALADEARRPGPVEIDAHLDDWLWMRALSDAFSEDDVERGHAGRFVSGLSKSALAEIPTQFVSGMPWRVTTQGAVWSEEQERQIPKLVAGTPDTPVTIEALIATQPSLTVTRILPLGTPTTFPIVIEIDGQRFIYDGHKRLARAITNGQTEADVRIVTLPSAQGTQTDDGRGLADWNEEDHPRQGGKFVSKGGTAERAKLSQNLRGVALLPDAYVFGGTHLPSTREPLAHEKQTIAPHSPAEQNQAFLDPKGIRNQKTFLPLVGTTLDVSAKEPFRDGPDHVNQAYKVTDTDGKDYLFKPEAGEAWGINDLGELTLDRGKIDQPIRWSISPDTPQSERDAMASMTAHALGLDSLVPSTRVVTVNGERGSVQEFVPNNGHANPETLAEAPRADIQKLMVFDSVIGNTDRHWGNLLAREDGTLAAIDNGLTFGSGYWKPQDHRVDEFRSVAADAVTEGAGLGEGMSVDEQHEMGLKIAKTNWTSLTGGRLNSDETKALQHRARQVAHVLLHGNITTLPTYFR